MSINTPMFATCERRKQYYYWTFISFVSVLYLIIAASTPISVMAWQVYDDMLYINHAQSLAEGRWLGAYSELTLVKGPGYPYFLALNYWLGLPISVSHALFYCFSLMFVSAFVIKISKSYFLASVVFLFTVWDPRVFELSRIMRDAIYPGQSILVLTLFTYILFFSKKGKAQYLYSVIAGVVFGWFWLTREEGIWLIPGLAILLAYTYFPNAHRNGKVKLIVPLLIFIVSFIVTLSAFNIKNLYEYNEFVGVDVKERNFQAAMKAMESVRVGNPVPFLSVPRSVREELYEISPSFFELKKYIDPEGAVSPWATGGCLFRKTTCGDIGNGFYFWAVRDAAAKAGHYSSPAESSAFYRKITLDIQNACEKKRLTCEDNFIPYMPPITYEQLKTVPFVLKNLFYSLYSAGTVYYETPWKIWGPEYTFNRALSILNYPAHYPVIRATNSVEMAGWFLRKSKSDDWFLLEVYDDYNESIPFELTRINSPDLVSAFDDEAAVRQRFKIKLKCSDGCIVSFNSSVGISFIVPVKNYQTYYSKDDVILAFDYVHDNNADTEVGKIRYEFNLNVRTFIHQVYYYLLPLLLVVGVLSFFLSCYMAHTRSNYIVLLGFAGAFWISILARSAILVLVDISSFPAITVPYMQPIFVLSIIASILSIGSIVQLQRDYC